MKKYLFLSTIAITISVLFSSVAFAVSGQMLTKTLSIGSKGSDVLVLQQFLKTKGYLSVTPNGIYGPATTKAVKAFQIDSGISPTGGIGPMTLKAFNNAQGGSPTSGIPAVSTLKTISITNSSATLHGSISVTNIANKMTPTFLYGKTIQYGMTTQAESTIDGFTAKVTGLSCGTTYHYKFSANNSSGTSNGGDMTFTTLSC